jgi:hypothetical protein
VSSQKAIMVLDPNAILSNQCWPGRVIRPNSSPDFSKNNDRLFEQAVNYLGISTTRSEYDVDEADVTIGAGQPVSGRIPKLGVIPFTLADRTSSDSISFNRPTS